MILAVVLLTGTFFLISKLITFLACSLKEVQHFFIQSSPRYKVFLFSMLSKDYIVDIEYPQGICSPIFVAEAFSRLFANPFILLIKDSISA